MGLLARLTGRTDSRPLPRRDGFVNELTGQGGPLDRSAWTRFAPPGLALTPNEIDALMRHCSIARTACEAEAEDATREGIELVHPDPVVVAEVKARLAALGEQQCGALNEIGTARTWEQAYGGAAMLLFVDDGRPESEPLGEAGRLLGVLTLDRYEIRPARETSTWWRVEHYEVNSRGGKHLRVHRSRVIVFPGLRLSWREQQRNDGWGGSILDLAFDEIRNWSGSNSYVAEAITLLTQGVFMQKGMANAAVAGNSEAIANRAEALRIGLGLFGDMVLDAETEDYKTITRPLAGVGEAGEILERALIAAVKIPRVRLFGETPGGLHTGEARGEIRGWYDRCSVMQNRHYEPPLRRIIRMIAREMGVQPPGIQWNPLYALTEQEQAQTDLTRAQRRQADVVSGVVSPDEVRKDPDLVRLYGIDPNEPAPMGGGGEEPDPALQEPVAADPSAIRPGAEMLTAADTALRLGVSSAVVHRLAVKGAFPAWRIGGRWMYDWQLVAEHARSNVRALPQTP